MGRGALVLHATWPDGLLHPPPAPPRPGQTILCLVREPSLLEQRALRLQAQKSLPAPPSCCAILSCSPSLLAQH